MSTWQAIMLYILLLIFGSFIPDRAVPATNIVACNKVHPYSSMWFLSLHVRSMNTCAKREHCRYKLQCADLADGSQYYNHRVWLLSRLLLVFLKAVLSRGFCHGKYTFTLF